ncbi:MAG: hypothetical protein V1709_00950 [Planctomycetota bacterium]
MKVINMIKAEADRVIASIDTGIKQEPKEGEIKIRKSESILTPEIKVIFYSCKNKRGGYEKYEIYQNDKLIVEEISFSALTLCKKLNAWMRRNKI